MDSRGVLSYNELHELVDQGVIRNIERSQINGASINIRLGNEFIVEEEPADTESVLYFSQRTRFKSAVRYGGVTLAPGAVALAASVETFYLPNNIAAEFKLRSSSARTFIEHLNAGWCDPGWNGSALTMELKNMLRFHSIRLREHDSIGQMVFFRVSPVPEQNSYAAVGRYNNDTSVTGVKP